MRSISVKLDFNDVCDMVLEEFNDVIEGFEKDLEDYADNDVVYKPIVFSEDHEEDIAIIKKYLEAFKLVRSYFTVDPN